MVFSDRFAALYAKHIAGSGLLDLFTSLASETGLSMTFPGTPSVTLLTENGEQRFVPLTQFQAIIQKSDQISCQFWWNDSEDLYCRVIRDEDGISIQLGLDGTSVEQEQKVIQALRQIFVMLASEGSAWGLIIDRFGVTAESPWKDILLGRTPLEPPYPDEILLPMNAPCLRSVDKQSCRLNQIARVVMAIRPVV